MQGPISRICLAGAAPLLLAAGVQAAQPSGICQARFMHDGGHLKVSGTGIVQVQAQLSFSGVSKQGADRCSATVRGNAAYSLAGLPGGESDIDHQLRVTDGRSSFQRRGGSSSGGDFDLRLLGLFGYGTPIEREGQRLPGESFQLAVGDRGPKGQVGLPPTTFHIGERVVGARERIDTAAAGSQQCWPIRYSRETGATQASFNGLVLPIPAMRSQVTDWFCPDVGMVLKQEIVQAGQRAVIEVTEVR
ncbi:hypothetical protein V8Z80_18245 [Orrella sp. JC864]|uniref:hypothetical protein n=1 Tax=Orrella sp. JC864 TaxID=3120298 RepID=UPI0012BB9471